MEKQFKRGAKPYLKANEVKNIMRGAKYSKEELEPINDYLKANNLTYTQLVKRAIKVYINSDE